MKVHIAQDEVLVFEAEAALVGLGDFVEAVEVQLSDEGLESAVPEVFRQDLFNE